MGNIEESFRNTIYLSFVAKVLQLKPQQQGNQPLPEYMLAQIYHTT